MAAKKTKAVRKSKPSKTKKAAKRTVKQTKGLDDLLKQAMTDGEFVRGLETAPAATLKKHGYPAGRALVTEIQKIDFDVFRKSFLPGPSPYWC